MSIDIDGNDYYVWRAINVIKPRVVVIEYNAKFPPNHAWRQAYNAEHGWDGSDWHGASLKALEQLGRELGYQLVGTNIRGVNAFFVKQELADDHFIEPATSEVLYNPARFKSIRYTNGHQARYCLHNQFSNIGMLNYVPSKIEEFFDKRNQNFFSDAIKFKAQQKFEQLPPEKYFHPTRTHSTFFLPNGDVDLLQQVILLTDDYHEAEMLHEVTEKFQDGLLKRVLGEKDGVVVDAGAGIGNRLLYFANELRAENFIAFEPIKELFEILKRNVEINGLSDRTQIYRRSLAEHIGRASIRSFNPENMKDTLFVGNDGEIELMPLDALELPKLTLLNIDTADMELRIVKGAIDTLKRTRPLVLVKSFIYTFPEVEEFFFHLGYSYDKLSKNDYIFYPN